MKVKFFNKAPLSFLLFVFKQKRYFLFRKTNVKIKRFNFFKKVFISTGLFSKCFLILPKHENKIIGLFKVSRKLYNSAIRLRKLKR